MPELLDLAPDLDDAAVLEATAAVDRDDVPEAAEVRTADGQPAPPAAQGADGPLVRPASRPRPARPAVPRRAPEPAPEAATPEPPLPLNGQAEHRPVPAGQGPNGHGPNGHEPDGLERTATAPQLRRFIKSRAYVPMHELRRRFAIDGGEDDVTPIELDRQRIYVGLPPREGGLLGELLRAGDIGYELSMDPIAPIVVGVYPMRPVPRS